MPTDTAAGERPQVKPFAAFVQENRNGAMHAELSGALADLVAACQELGKSGTLTLKLSVKPDKKLGTLTITDDVVAKPPRADRSTALYWADDHGNLSRNPPNQQTFELRDVGGGAEEQTLREAK